MPGLRGPRLHRELAPPPPRGDSRRLDSVAGTDLRQVSRGAPRPPRGADQVVTSLEHSSSEYLAQRDLRRLVIRTDNVSNNSATVFASPSTRFIVCYVEPSRDW